MRAYPIRRCTNERAVVCLEANARPVHLGSRHRALPFEFAANAKRMGNKMKKTTIRYIQYVARKRSLLVC